MSEPKISEEITSEPIKKSIINVFDTSKKRLLIENKEMKVEDIRMSSNYSGRGLWTEIYVTLQAKQQFLYLREPYHDIKYKIFDGAAWVMQGTKGEMIKKGQMIIVEKGMPHTVLSSDQGPCKFLMELQGDYDLVKVINDKLNKVG